MFDLVNGLPIHPLVVHAVVVLLPAAILGTIAIAIRPDWRRRYGHLVVAGTAVGTVLIPVATSSGEQLQKHVGDPGQHAQLGDQLIWFALPLMALSATLVFLDRRAAKASLVEAEVAKSKSVAPNRRLVGAVAVLATVSAVAAGVQVYRVGDSGARAAWGDQVAAK
jgi:uncharacterized membrane protein